MLFSRKFFQGLGRNLRPPSCLPVLLETRRRGLVETRLRGCLTVVDGQGKLRYRLGDFGGPVYLRSCAKPFQVLPLFSSGAAEFFGFLPEEIAVACASHQAEPAQVRAVQGILAKAGLEASSLRCGLQSGRGGGGRPNSALLNKLFRQARRHAGLGALYGLRVGRL